MSHQGRCLDKDDSVLRFLWCRSHHVRSFACILLWVVMHTITLIVAPIFLTSLYLRPTTKIVKRTIQRLFSTIPKIGMTHQPALSYGMYDHDHTNASRDYCTTCCGKFRQRRMVFIDRRIKPHQRSGSRTHSHNRILVHKSRHYRKPTTPIKMKFTLAATTLLAASASAFVPQQQRTSVQTTTALNNDMFDGDDKDSKKEMSQALPFVPRPKLLDGTLPGDVGFE